jgi:two-component system, OmpR family, phosphate regulon sensor histidine kinase PhoR
MKPRKLIWQIYPAIIIIVLVVIAAVTWYGSGIFRSFYLEKAESDLESRGNLVRYRIGDYLNQGDTNGLRQFCKDAGRSSGTRITIIDRGGRVLADSNENPETMDNHRLRPEVVSAYAGDRGSSIRFSTTLKEKMLYIAIPLNGTTDLARKASAVSGVNAVIRMAVPITELDHTMGKMYMRIALGCMAIGVMAAFLTLFISRNISRPLEEMTRSAERFARGDFSQRMQPLLHRASSLEVAELAAAMDRMAELLDEKIKAIVTHRNQLETVFSSMVESVIALDREERVISINSAAAQLLGIQRKEAQGKFIQEILRNIPLQKYVQQILNSGESLEDEIVLQDGCGEKYLQTSVVTLSDGKGKSVGVLIVMNDVTHLRRLERIRRDFVANVSHELRTPITSIRGYVETLLDGALDSREDSVHFLEIVLRQSDRLSAIIDDLLSLSSIEQESREICREEGQLYRVLDAAAQTCRLMAEQRGVDVHIVCPENIIALMNVTLLEQAVVNLLVNAITYSKFGDTVRIETGVAGEPGDGKVRIAVIDTGCGIAREHLPRLFERFYRSDKARSRDAGGTGLGLAIVKHIVQAHDGTVEVTSVEGKGSEFTVTIPGRME